MTEPAAYRLERPGEQAQVAEVVRAAFGRHQGVETLVQDLRRSDAWLGLSFVATPDELSGVVVGHVAFTRSRLDAPASLVDVLVLSPLSVLPEHQGRGIGSGLVRYALSELRGRPEPLVFLEGSPDFYARFGFVAGEPRGFRRPSLRIPPAAFQVRPLAVGDPPMSGTLVYHRAFWDHDAVGLRDRSS